MKIVKLYRKPNQPEFYALIRQVEDAILVNYPIDKPYRKRDAKWLQTKHLYIDWIRDFND